MRVLRGPIAVILVGLVLLTVLAFRVSAAEPTAALLPATPTVAASPLAQQLAAQLAPECADMTAPQVLAQARAVVAAERQAGTDTTVERVLSVAVGAPDMVENLHGCAAVIQTAALYDRVYGVAAPTPTAGAPG